MKTVLFATLSVGFKTYFSIKFWSICLKDDSGLGAKRLVFSGPDPDFSVLGAKAGEGSGSALHYFATKNPNS